MITVDRLESGELGATVGRLITIVVVVILVASNELLAGVETVPGNVSVSVELCAEKYENKDPRRGGCLRNYCLTYVG